MSDHFELSRRGFLAAGGAALALGTNLAGPAVASEAKLIDPNPKTGTAAAVVVDNMPLVHTEQIAIAGAASFELQVSGLIDALDNQLRGTGTALDSVVKLNFYLGPGVASTDVERVLAKRFSGEKKPAVCYVNGKLSTLGADIALDAVARRGAHLDTVVSRFPGAAILPAGDKLYISGDASPGSVAEATLHTLESLERTLKFAGLDWSHAVQLKSFLDPIGAADEVRGVMKKFFGDRPVPVLSFVEWKSPKLPIEIELIAACPARKTSEPIPAVEYLTPPGMTASPVFSRAARVHSDKTIYISGLYGNNERAPARRIREMFWDLGALLKKVGSDMNHLAKATYYVADDEVSKELGAVRPEFYDPKRPPAASKALVTGVGRAGHSITMDMIAVPKA